MNSKTEFGEHPRQDGPFQDKVEGAARELMEAIAEESVSPRLRDLARQLAEALQARAAKDEPQA